ncbi:MAG: hypothetical protein RLZZ58_526, partial [Pseudomonadota bacterium]
SAPQPPAPTPAGRAPWLRRAAALVGGLTLATMAFQSAAGFVVGKANPALGQRLSPGHATPLAQRVDNALLANATSVDRGAVREAALAAVLRSPLDHRTARSIALLDKAAGFEKSSSRILTLVGRATLHDTFAHAFLLDGAYKRGDYRAVVREADIVMRTDPRVKTEAHMMLTAIVADGRAVPDLGRKLAADPKWRAEFLEIMGARGNSPQNEERLYRLLLTAPVPPRAAELRAWMMRRVSDTPANALRAKFDALSPVKFGAGESAIRNGDFEGSKIFEPYNWTLLIGDNRAGEIGPGPSGPGKALFAEFDRNAVGGVASQLLTLAPGRYRVRARSYALTELTGDSGLALACVNGRAPAEFVHLPLRTAVETWVNVGWDLDVPADCQGPLLTIARKAGRLTKLEQFYLDDIVITPRKGPAKAETTKAE